MSIIYFVQPDDVDVGAEALMHNKVVPPARLW